MNLLYSLLYVLPRNLISGLLGFFARTSFPGPLQQKINHYFIKKYSLNMEEAEKEDFKYRSLNELFTRKLKNECRPLADGILHPADSRLTQYGVIKDGTMIQAKGFFYHLNEFLGQSPHYQRLKNGFFFTYYLCPTDYHRVHSPVDGEISESLYIPGDLWPVNDWSVEKIHNLFSVNERVVTFLQTSRGLCAVVMVGATNVGQMTLAFDSEIRTNNFINRNRVYRKYDPPVSIKKGEEIGTFHMGSTVVVIYEKSFFEDIRFARGGSVKMGQQLLP